MSLRVGAVCSSGWKQFALERHHVCICVCVCVRVCVSLASEALKPQFPANTVLLIFLWFIVIQDPGCSTNQPNRHHDHNGRHNHRGLTTVINLKFFICNARTITRNYHISIKVAFIRVIIFISYSYSYP